MLRAADPHWAPFELLTQAPGGEILDLLCYAFTANEYRQSGRPAGEHRFQVKYGSEFHRYHDLFLDPERQRVTLMFGVHDELPLFIAVDPRMHTPTWFSSSVEFKRAELDQALEKGWHGWQRDRKEGRRKRSMPELDLRTESVIAFRPEQFLRYVYFERLASGMDCGERLSLSDTVETEVAAGKPLPAQTPVTAHRLESVLGLSADEVLQVIGDRFRLMAAVRGGVAEHHLGKLLAKVPGVSDLERLDRDGHPDFELKYRRAQLRIECKNVLARLAGGKPKVDFQRTRHAKDDPCSRYYKRTSSICWQPACIRSRDDGSSSSTRRAPCRCTRRVLGVCPRTSTSRMATGSPQPRKRSTSSRRRGTSLGGRANWVSEGRAIRPSWRVQR